MVSESLDSAVVGSRFEFDQPVGENRLLPSFAPDALEVRRMVWNARVFRRVRRAVLNHPRELGVTPTGGATVTASMPDDPRPCCGGTAELTAENETSAGRRTSDASALETELPRDLRSALGRFLGVDSVETLGAWAAEVRRRVGGGTIGVEELCLTSEKTEHWGTVDGERYHFACFYDAVILAALSDRPVDIRTKSPDGTVIEARAVGGNDLTVTPEGAVFSFGIDRSVEPPADGGPTLERGYAAICPYVKAFPNPGVYERWAKNAPAATVALPLAGATELAAELAGDPRE